MKLREEQFISHQVGPKEGSSDSTIDRRRFLRDAAALGAVAGFGESAFGQAQGATATTDLRLPDGTEHVSWEQSLTFSKTYYVDNNSTKADDNGPGTSARPFRTINKAAQVLQPGERVVIASGTYREWVRQERGAVRQAEIRRCDRIALGKGASAPTRHRARRGHVLQEAAAVELPAR